VELQELPACKVQQDLLELEQLEHLASAVQQDLQDQMELQEQLVCKVQQDRQELEQLARKAQQAQLVTQVPLALQELPNQRWD
jgi:hypothetical protein